MTEERHQRQTRFTEYNNKGITGLANLGNTCFINACIQCISHTYELNDFLSKTGKALFLKILTCYDDIF